jgi:hypothetical protein
MGNLIYWVTFSLMFKQVRPEKAICSLTPIFPVLHKYRFQWPTAGLKSCQCFPYSGHAIWGVEEPPSSSPRPTWLNVRITLPVNVWTLEMPEWATFPPSVSGVLECRNQSNRNSVYGWGILHESGHAGDHPCPHSYSYTTSLAHFLHGGPNFPAVCTQWFLLV